MTLYHNIDENKRKTAIFMVFFVILVITVGYIFSLVYNSPVILIIAIIIALTQSLFAYYNGDKVALMSTGAREIQKKDQPELWRLVENLAITAGLPMPKVYIINDPAPNAFATGRDPEHSSIAVTTGLLEMLDKQELEGVLAHELSHIGNFDIRLMMIIVVLVGVIAILSDLFIRIRFFGFGRRDNDSGGGQAQVIFLIIGIAAAILAPLVATLVQLAISRKREFLADSSGALLTRYPEGLAEALIKISKYQRPMNRVSSATAHLFISNPFGRQSSISKLFSTHPPVEERVKALEGMKV